MATYYIDYAAANDSANGTTKATPWKRCPGMTGWSGSGSLTSDDRVIFKGGTTWTSSFPWTLTGGTLSHPITYTTDQTWYSGGSWARPIFDRQNARANLLTGASYTTLNDLDFRNVGSAYVETAVKGLDYANCRGITITNCFFSLYCWISVYVHFDSSGTYANFTFTNNIGTNTTGLMWFASAASNVVMQNLVYTDCRIYDFANQLGGGAHGDGFLHYFNAAHDDSTQYLDGFVFMRNWSYGDFTRGITPWTTNEDMTGLIYFEGAVKNGLIANNIFSFSPGANTDGGGASIFESPINLRSYGNAAATTMKVYNNTIWGDPTKQSGSSAVLVGGSWPTVDLKNNIFVFGRYGGYGEDGNPPGLINDYNEWWTPDGFVTFGSYGTHNLPSGSPYTSNPYLTTANGLASGNYTPTASSPGRAVGIDLSATPIPVLGGYLTTDFNGNTRTGAWSMGAVQYGAGSSPPVGTPVLSVR